MTEDDKRHFPRLKEILKLNIPEIFQQQLQKNECYSKQYLCQSNI